MIAITFDPSKYGFQINDADNRYKDICEENFAILKENIKQDLAIDVFNYLKEMINNCPQKMEELLSGWYNEIENGLSHIKENEGAKFLNKLRTCSQIRLSKTSFRLRYWKRNEENYKFIK